QHPIQPIDVRYTTLGGFEYSSGEKKLDSNRDLEGIMEPLGDHEVDRLMKKSRDSDLLAVLSRAAGVIGAAAGLAVLAGEPSRKLAVQWALPLGGGLVLLDIGGLFGSEA